MRHTLRFATILCVGILLASLITPLAQFVVEGVGFEVSPYRVWNRLALAALVTAAVLSGPRRGSLREFEQPFRPREGRWREVAAGVVGGLACCLALLSWLVWQGTIRFSMEFNWADDGLKLFLIVPVGAATVALLEEWIFRQQLLIGFRRDRGTAYALITTSLVFGAVHFFHMPRTTPPPDDSIFLGFVILGDMLANVLVAEKQLAFVGLVLTGLIFGLARLLTGRLYLAMGLHAGFVFYNRMDGPFTSWNVEEHTIWTGGRQYIAGIPGWISLLALTAILGYLVRRNERRTGLAAAAAAVPIPVTPLRTSSPTERS